MKAKVVAPECASERGIVVEVDQRIWEDICKSFPVGGVRKDVAEKNRLCRLIILSQILSLLRSHDKTFCVNKTLMSKMRGVSRGKREVISRYWRTSKFFAVKKKHSGGNQSAIWTIRGVRIVPIVGQDNMEPGSHGSVSGACENRIWWRTGLSGVDGVRGGLASWVVCWKFGGKCVDANVPWSWFRSYGESYRRACASLWGREWEHVGCVERSVKSCVVDVPTLGDCLKLVQARLALENLELTQEERSEIETCTAWYWHRSWSEWARDPLLYLIRKKGRLYYGLVNQPRDLRYRYLKWQYNGRRDDAVEVDLSATYWVLLTNLLDGSDCKRRLIEALTSGTFYMGLNDAIGGQFTSSKDLKIAVQRDCLFGRRNFGRSRLFNTMFQLYPDLGKYILSLRRHRKVSGLSDLLMKEEGRFFIDLILPRIVNLGIPSLPIHDAIVVPRSAAEMVRETCLSLAEGHFGFRPKFKISEPVTSV